MWKTGDLGENPPATGIVRHDSLSKGIHNKFNIIKPEKDTMSEYIRRVTFLRRFIETNKLVSFSHFWSANCSIAVSK
ncbi:hypothetical protein PR048_009605 [Dryococelus australis]|uniref:Uncharacterized protein n=1 Tax=Dryococelus australis TaxID=614101 RepID=A0ABQ9I0C3_9NEOP|nr:hypothetical protein PR048_009605 [Dryococelus australis]